MMTDFKPAQLTAADVARLRAKGREEEIVAAKQLGQLDDLLGVVKHHAPNDGTQWSLADVQALSAEQRYDEISLAKTAGWLDQLSGTETR